MENQPKFSAFFRASRPESGGFSEMLDAEGAPRPHWRELLACLDGLGAAEITARSENSRQMIREHGVTSDIGDETGGMAHPWELDILPLVIGAREWKTLEAGLVQRARLVNRVLCDLYGTQSSLRNGWLPPSAVYANSKFLRGCHGVRVPGGNYLSLYAVDLARSPDGRWWVLADRTQSPSGVGFALENRSVVSSVLPEAVDAIRHRSIGGMLPLIRETLASIAPQQGRKPTTVVLTPGPHHEAYFEHTYLARMLGFPLVEGGDLTVRHRRVSLKTLEGLRRVDVILRRVSDGFCDPLEFRSDSLLGVPGLVEAVRSGTVSTGNALGCGLIESPVFMAFLPNLCQQFLGEELRIPSVATWWCGGARELEHVCERLDALVIRPAFSRFGTGNEADWPLEEKRSIAISQVRERPYAFVGQEEVVLSHAPVLANGRPGSAPFVLRAFVAGIGDSFHVMPGGLVRLVRQSKLASVAVPLGGGSKDLWVLAEEGAADEPLHAVPELSPFIERAPLDVPSRTADNLFWVGRYTERLENVLRIIRYAISSLSTDSGASGMNRLIALTGMLNRLELVPEADPAGNLRQTTAHELLSLISGADSTAGLKKLLNRIHLTTFAVRDRLSADTWRLLTRLESDLCADAHGLSLLAAASVLDTLVLDIAAFNGLAMENMTRGHGWMFLDFGRRLERSFNLVELFNATLAAGEAVDLLLEPVLDICDSLITYRRRHFAEIRLPAVLKLLLLEPHNPRSLAFQLAAMERSAMDLPKEPNPEGVAAIRRRVSDLRAKLHSFQIEEWEQMADGISEEMRSLSDLLTQVYFSHTVPTVTS